MAGERVRKTQDTCMASVELKCTDFVANFAVTATHFVNPMQNK